MQLTTAWSAVGIILSAIGEEVFFRGLLGGIFIRRLRFWWGNTLQALVFLMLHVPLLFVDVRLAAMLPAQFTAGWLRYKSGSFLPGGLVHAAVTIIAGLLALYQ